jgi:hypothetical protein
MASQGVRELSARVEALEKRVTELETVQPVVTGRGVREAQPAAEKFWVIDGLRRRLRGGGAVVFGGIAALATGEEYVWQWGRSSEELLAASWSDRSKAIAALGHPVRLRLLHLVLTGTQSTAELQAVEELGTTGQLYHHLRQLIATGWLSQSARGRYAVPGARVIPLLVILAAAEN